MTLRISLLLRKFHRLSGATIVAHAGGVMAADELTFLTDRKLFLVPLDTVVFDREPARKVRVGQL